MDGPTMVADLPMALRGKMAVLVAFLLPLEATLSTLELVEFLVLQLLDLTTQ